MISCRSIWKIQNSFLPWCPTQQQQPSSFSQLSTYLRPFGMEDMSDFFQGRRKLETNNYQMATERSVTIELEFEDQIEHANNVQVYQNHSYFKYINLALGTKPAKLSNYCLFFLQQRCHLGKPTVRMNEFLLGELYPP